LQIEHSANRTFDCDPAYGRFSLSDISMKFFCMSPAVNVPKPARQKASAGFTLLELLIVLVIMGLLASLIGPRLLDRVDTSKVTTAETQVRMLHTALDTLKLDIGRYPTAEEGLGLLTTPPTDDDLRSHWRGPYLEGTMPNDPWGRPFVYAPSESANPPFYLYSYGADGKAGGTGINKDVGLLPQS
jgi:general secretion pathway protein G